MSDTLYRYSFSPLVSIQQIEATLVLAILGAESLHGEAQVRLDVHHHLDPERRACVIDAGSEAGLDVNRLFAGFLGREYGPDAFRVERIVAVENRPAA